MKISINELKKYVKLPAGMTTSGLIELIGLRLVEVEGSEDWSEKYKNIRIVKVVAAEKIPETHLTLCRINAGECDFAEEDGLVQVVCGAPNVREGMLAVWLMPGAVVPVTFGEENFKLSVRKLRGFESKGMLAGLDELDLGDDHSGIVEIDPKMAKAGDSFAEVFELNDTILDIENKSLTHRPDCFGLEGFAREIAGICGVAYCSEDDQANKARYSSGGSSSCDDVCSRYLYTILNVEQLPKKSKYLTPEMVFLAKAGMRTIDSIVDWTNIVMLKTGQPLHAFDYDKFLAVGKTSEPKVVVRLAKNGEKLQLLDGKTIECDENDILVTSNDVPVALAGAMGGENTKIDASTKRVFLESASFSLYNLRKTQMKHGIFSEAITRFTKGLAPVMAERGMRFALDAAGIDIGGAEVVDVISCNKGIQNETILVDFKEILALLGREFSDKKLKEVLENVEFCVEEAGNGKFAVKAPAWRTDIHCWQDIAEEVGRLTGYENIVPQLPKRDYRYVAVDNMWGLKSKIRDILSDRLSMNEILTYSFVNGSLLEKAGEKLEDSYAIVNSISPDLQYFKQSLVPSILVKMRENLKAGYKDFALYEINQVSRKTDGLTNEKTPIVKNHLGIVQLNDYYSLKVKLETLFMGLKKSFEIRRFDSEVEMPYLEPKRSGSLYFGERKIGAIGEIKSGVLRKFKLEAPVSALEIDLEQVLEIEEASEINFNLTKYPYVERDITYTVPAKMRFVEVQGLLSGALAGMDLLFEIEPRSIYQANENDETKNVSFHIRFAKPDKTLESGEISGIMEEVERIV